MPKSPHLYHFTRVEHLASMVQRGVRCDRLAHEENLLAIEIGDPEIKQRRQNKQVPVEPHGVLADYVPFYFAPRSPMMYRLHRHGVDSYHGGCERLVYLVTVVEQLQRDGHQLVFTDRKAAANIATFFTSFDQLQHLIDWPLMSEIQWANTESDPDRVQRRQAECLSFRHVQWRSILWIACRDPKVAEEVHEVLNSHDQDITVLVRPGWYF